MMSQKTAVPFTSRARTTNRQAPATFSITYNILRIVT